MKSLPFSGEELSPSNNNPDHHSLSRRQWLGRVTVPAIATIGATMIGVKANASPTDTKHDDEKTTGARIYNVRDFGAKGEGKTVDTAAIQSAIDACTHDNGGIVLLPAGDFLSGTLELKSNVTLH